MILQISQQINNKINELEDLKNKLVFNAAKEAEYQLKLAQVILRLKTIGETPTTIIRDIAKGECWQEQLDKDKEKTQYDIMKEKIDIVKAQLNGYQTINKHLEEI